jgi:hypothetical protein
MELLSINLLQEQGHDYFKGKLRVKNFEAGMHKDYAWCHI